MSNTKHFQPEKPLLLESGEQIDNLSIAYHTFGQLNGTKNNVVWVFHALTANSNAMEWWNGLFGENDYFNPKDHFIICANVLGSPYGSTAPQTKDFPVFSVRDVVSAHLLLAQHLNIEEINVAIGGSFGGNQALEFAYSFKGVIDRLILIASCSRESAWGIAVHESQRLALESDPTLGQPNGGISGMKAARSLAMLTYRTSDAFIATQTDGEETFEDFKASSYIQYQGDKFTKRFDALSYYYLSKCLDRHNIGRGRGGESHALSKISIPTLIIGIESDVLIPVRLQEYMNEHIPNSVYKQISSNFGHDGFLVETKKITKEVSSFLNKREEANDEEKRTVLKFGGKSLVNGKPIHNVIDIVRKESQLGPTTVVVSARGNSTDILEILYEKALKNEDYSEELKALFQLQYLPILDSDLTEEKKYLSEKLHAISVLGLGSDQIKNEVMALGELMCAKSIAAVLNDQGLKAVFKDAREIIKTIDGVVNLDLSKELTNEYFGTLSLDEIPVITGFIARDQFEKTETLGRNGSNYSATLVASFIQAKEVQNWTNIDGVYTASPKYVQNASKISSLTYKEAHELANFGANILHHKTIQPLIKHSIPLKILNTNNPSGSGTYVSKTKQGKGMKAVSVIEDVALVKIEGSGLHEKVGIDARIFTALSKNNISIKVISQASSERGVGFVISESDRILAEKALLKEFEIEIQNKSISSISVNENMAIIAIIGRHNFALEKAISGLRKNKIWMHMISNSISGEHISLVIEDKHLKKAVNVVHSQVFGVVKTLHAFAFGKGTVGGRFIDQILSTSPETEERRSLRIKLVGIADSKRAVFNESGLGKDWEKQLIAGNHSNHPDDIIRTLSASGLENVVIVDNTASNTITQKYPSFVTAGFDVVASNKQANSMNYSFYESLRGHLKSRGKKFLYETNVGAGLPIIDTLKYLYDSADNVTRVTGVFSGSLSYIFNNFSVKDVPFSEVMLEAREKGFTEPDPREDLKGMDVARKLLILARELGAKIEMDQIKIQNLVPEALRDLVTYEEFIAEQVDLDFHYAQLKTELKPGHVYRYTGDLNMETSELTVSLVQVPADSPLGGIKNADAIFEIYTETYGDQPMIIQGAGAGAAVTARGVYSDLLRLGKG